MGSPDGDASECNSEQDKDRIGEMGRELNADQQLRTGFHSE